MTELPRTTQRGEFIHATLDNAAELVVATAAVTNPGAHRVRLQ